MIIDNRNNSSNEYGTWLSFEAILLNDSGSEIISLDKMDGELILTCRLVNVRKNKAVTCGLSFMWLGCEATTQSKGA